jgi:hypothetical protein
MTGKLKKVFNEVHSDRFSVDLSTFCFGGRQRKFYLSDQAGLIRQYNMKNGEFLKDCNDINELEENPEFKKKCAHIPKKELNEISQMIYLLDVKLLVAACMDSTIRIYDEAEQE